MRDTLASRLCWASRGLSSSLTPAHNYPSLSFISWTFNLTSEAQFTFQVDHKRGVEGINLSNPCSAPHLGRRETQIGAATHKDVGVCDWEMAPHAWGFQDRDTNPCHVSLSLESSPGSAGIAERRLGIPDFGHCEEGGPCLPRKCWLQGCSPQPLAPWSIPSTLCFCHFFPHPLTNILANNLVSWTSSLKVYR